MLDKLILLSGPISSGKSTLALGLSKHYSIPIFKTSEIIRSKMVIGQTANRQELQDEGDKYDKQTSGRWVLDELMKWSAEHDMVSGVIIDSVRIIEQISAIREVYWPHVLHIHLTAPKVELEKRYSLRPKVGPDAKTKYEKVKENSTENQIESLSESADLVIDTKRCTINDVLTKALSYIEIEGATGRGYVDVVVGGQYGSEGKGQICAYLSEEYDILVRVGGPNAGHSVFERSGKHIYHILPSGTRMNPRSKIIIGAGAVLRLDTILEEIRSCNVDQDRLSIDSNAMVILDEDVEAEEELKKSIGSTGRGVGAATARRIMRSHATKLAKDFGELKPFIRDTSTILEDAFTHNKKVLLEGTQGTGLSLYHGSYPYVTSRETTVSGCLAEAGIAPNRVRKVIIVCRVYPIRVQDPPGSTSGPLSQEISWKEVADRSGYTESELLGAEKTSTTGRQRRVGEFEWDLLHKAAVLNGATDVALTFTDYICKKNTLARRIEQLSPRTLNFIQEVERVANAPVSLISTGFNQHSVIDRRTW